MLLSMSAVSAGYKPIPILQNIDLDLDEGEICCVLGSNGAGKSTLLNALSGLVNITSGVIQFAGENITRIPAHERVMLGICQVPQGRRIFSDLTVLENLEMGAFGRSDSRGIRADLAFIYERFPRLHERMHQLGGALSGGEQQLLAISRALMARPLVLLLDEPSMGLAPLYVRQVYQLIRDINQRGTAVLIVEQNAYMALAVSQRAYLLQGGTISQSGPAEMFRRDSSVVSAYLGGQER